jgi:hypothetical protein
VPKRLPNSCPDCNGCVNLESMLCEDCGLSMLPRLTGLRSTSSYTQSAPGLRMWTRSLKTCSVRSGAARMRRAAARRGLG